MANGKTGWKSAIGTIIVRAPLLVLAIILAGCSALKKESAAPVLPVHYVHQDGFDVTWREQQEGDQLHLYGVLRNNTPLFLENLSMTVNLLDEEGTVVDTRTFTDFPIVFLKRTSQPFSMRFPFPSCRAGERVLIELSYFLANPIGPHFNLYQAICFLDEKKRR